ncbi:hypothetical protein ACFPIK_14060 [Algoriphagus aquatilis]|uniref:Uncharacterized protein n=1 Tax=Algoriphagus aquatilis TaxID=490186 RepID=A0ABW0BZL0_9BACT
MAKHKIKLDDSFFFSFPKIMPVSETEKYEISDSVLLNFIENCENFQLRDLIFSKKYQNLLDKATVNFEIEPLYLLEFDIAFSGIKLGGILHRPDFIDGSKVNLYSIDKNYTEDDNNYYIRISLRGELIWDFKTNYLNKYKAHVEYKGSKWENTKLDIRINFRSNPIKVVGLNKLIQDNDNSAITKEYLELKDTLEKTPNIHSLIKNYSPEKSWELKIKHWQKLSEKNIKFDGTYFSNIL